MHSWELMIMGKAKLGLGDPSEAKNFLRQSLQQALMVHRWGHALVTLTGIADLFVKDGKEERALELLELIMTHPASWQMAKDQAVPLIAKLESELSPDVVAAAKERSHALELDATAEELLVELAESA
jgi:hypothetical protein